MKQTITRRAILAGAAAAAVAGCARGPEPRILGGAVVDRAGTLMQAIERSSGHTRLTAALRETGLDELLESAGPYTLLAPTDAAFAALRPKADAARLAEDLGYLKFVLRGHILPAIVTEEDIAAALPGMSGETRVFPLNNQLISIRRWQGDNLRAFDVRGRDSDFGAMDVFTANGILHTVDTVLLPEGDAAVSP